MSLESGKGSSNLTPEIKSQLIIQLGSLLHDDWRATRRQEDGSFEPRMKKTKDENWIAAHGSSEVDIANTSFEKLPLDWQAENRAAAEVAMEELFNHVQNGGLLDNIFIEQASSVIHERWVTRNDWVKHPEYGNPTLAVEYSLLPEEEKEKDRAQIKKAIGLYEAL